MVTGIGRLPEPRLSWLTSGPGTSDWVAETSSNEARFRGKVVELWSGRA